jgi:hypothetical protein
MSRRNWEFARENHTRETFAANFSRVISEIMTAESQRRQLARNPIETRAVSPELVMREML